MGISVDAYERVNSKVASPMGSIMDSEHRVQRTLVYVHSGGRKIVRRYEHHTQSYENEKR